VTSPAFQMQRLPGGGEGEGSLKTAQAMRTPAPSAR